MTDDDNTMRAVVVVAYIHGSTPADKLKSIQSAMLDALEDEDDGDDSFLQLAESRIVMLDGDESLVFHVEDLEDLDEDDAREMDDLRELYIHPSTPR